MFMLLTRKSPIFTLKEFNLNSSQAQFSTSIARCLFAISPGQKVAICGRTGSGKSSILLALFRLLDPSSGTISIDNLPITSIPRSFLRSRLNIIPQDAVIFPGSARMNVLSRLATSSSTSSSFDMDEEIIKALKTVNLWPTIASLGGLDADLSAIPLSQEQKQLFCLARAIFKSRTSPHSYNKILVLDEATSNVDVETEALMQHVISEEWKGKTVLVVVHKLAGVVRDDAFDGVVVMDGGRVVEVGAPGQLLGREGGVFKGLWESRA
jgi:ATP-binding cassette subfamily C (CFTR/MRP) protein 1